MKICKKLIKAKHLLNDNNKKLAHMALLPHSTKNPKPQNTQIQDDLNLVFSFSCTDVARKPRPTSLTVICVCFHQTSTNLSWEKCLPSFKTENEKKVTESDASK